MRFWLSILAVLVSLSACTTPDAFSERARLKPLREAALKGNDKALVQLRAEADRGNPEAQNQLAHYYIQHADGTVSDAMKLWGQAADQGYAPAQYNLGYMYDTRFHILNIEDEEEAQKKAVYWYRKAGLQGDGPSGYRIYSIWLRDGVNATVKYKNIKTGEIGPKTIRPPVSAEEAVSWLKHAAERNHDEAKFWLASFYGWDKNYGDSGLVDKSPDYKEAYFWISIFLKGKRAHNLAEGIDKWPAKFAAHLTKEEIRQVDARVRQWNPVPMPFPQAQE